MPVQTGFEGLSKGVRDGVEADRPPVELDVTELFDEDEDPVMDVGGGLVDFFDECRVDPLPGDPP